MIIAAAVRARARRFRKLSRPTPQARSPSTDSTARTAGFAEALPGHTAPPTSSAPRRGGAAVDLSPSEPQWLSDANIGVDTRGDVEAANNASSEDDGDHGRKRPSVALGVAFILGAVSLGVFGFAWTRTVHAPRFAEACIPHSGGCLQEQNGVFLYVNDPDDPVAISVEYSVDLSQPATSTILVGTDVPAGRHLRWMIELVGTARLRPVDVSVPGTPRKRRVFDLGSGTTYRSLHLKTPNSGNSVQVLTGQIGGPVHGYGAVRAFDADPVGFSDDGVVSITTGVLGPLVNINSQFYSGDLPYVFATPPDQVPGSPAQPPGIAPERFPLPGRWFYPKKSTVDESFNRPIDSDLVYSETEPLQPGNTLWRGSGYSHGRFVLEDVGAEIRASDREFWAGVALGLAGTCLIAALQCFGTLPSRRPRR